MITYNVGPHQLQRAMAMGPAVAAFWAPHINVALSRAMIQTPYDACVYLAQTGHESSSYTRMVESLNYKPDALIATFSAFRKNPALAHMYGRTAEHPANQRMIGNIAYGGRGGNRPNTDDGFNFRGRGNIQATFLSNYDLCGTFLRLPLILRPELLEQPQYGVLTGSWYWHAHKLWGTTIDESTRRINGPAMKGLDDRRTRMVACKAALGVA